jgi:hypothetical protein
MELGQKAAFGIGRPGFSPACPLYTDDDRMVSDPLEGAGCFEPPDRVDPLLEAVR